MSKSDPDLNPWPPEIGSMIAALYEDTFYIGKVCSKLAKDGSVNVDYMERYMSHQDKDKYWVWPKKSEIYPTSQECVLGQNLRVELLWKDPGAEDGNNEAVYNLNNFEVLSKLATKSKKMMG